jgi:hypothetical protein
LQEQGWERVRRLLMKVRGALLVNRKKRRLKLIMA